MQRPGITPADPLIEAARKNLRFYFEQMEHFEPGTRRGEDIEDLHEMRVAIRKMRSVLDVFEGAFTGGAIKFLKKDLRAAGKVLGVVRDLDVMIENARAYLQAGTDLTGQPLEILLSAWLEQRAVDRDQMVRYLEGQAFADFRERFDHFFFLPAERIAGKQAYAPLAGIAPTLLWNGYQRVLADGQKLATPAIEELHALRIQFKRLRYAFEFLREVLAGEGEDCIREIKKIQTHLGDLNDASVVSGLLVNFIAHAESQQKTAKALQPVRAYLVFCQKEMLQLRATFPALWTGFVSGNFAVNLEKSLATLA